MIVVDKSQIEGTARDASGPGWTSLRFLVKSHGLGFTMTETKVQPGSELALEYKNHVEACYCISGEGEDVAVDAVAGHPPQLHRTLGGVSQSRKHIHHR